VTVLVGVETLLLVLVALLVVGLLRSHAEILRRLEELGGEPQPTTATHRPATVAPAAVNRGLGADIAGEALDGEAVKIAVVGARRPTLLAFLSSGCLSCDRFWSALRGGGAETLPGEARPVVVVKGPDEESPSHLRELAAEDLALVMSTEAWEYYRVAGSPYFILVEPDGTIVGEGSASSWDQLVSLVRDAVGDAADGARSHRGGPVQLSDRGAARMARADAELEAAGIGPGHPSLYSSDGDDADTEGGSG
jgi:hypothetical protein